MTGLLDVRARRHVVDAHLTVPLDGPPVTVLFGPSGAGKTTILRAVAGLDVTDGGHVHVDGQVWDDGRRRLVPARDRSVGYLFQDHALFPHLGVRGNVAYGLHRVPRADRAARAADALATAGAAHLADRAVPDLSGGEAQRVALARALAPQPRLLLLDEPLSALDGPTRTRLRTDLRAVLADQGIPTLLVTHDRAEALALADRVAVVVDGTVRQVGSPTEVFDRPADPDVARVVGVETAVPGTVVGAGAGDGLAHVQVGPARLAALATEDRPYRHGEEVLVCVRAEDVALEGPAPHGAASPRNRLAATVTAVALEGPLVRVDLDAGFGLTAFITRPALTELDLSPGAPVAAVVKAPAVHLVRRDGPPKG
jgi:molybdate transport system ATP-binding protein